MEKNNKTIGLLVRRKDLEDSFGIDGLEIIYDTERNDYELNYNGGEFRSIQWCYENEIQNRVRDLKDRIKK